MERLHGRVFLQVQGVDVEVGGLEVYKVSFPRILKFVECLVKGCPARGKNPRRLRENFMF